ncbi:MAG: 3-dehydroquinate synthase [Lentisphaerae bacterium RIFOXYA12_FULL_48_11]|nr:MAG: 3-dehydroquinate synthase [Lentisphaerae bacterium RIFOXYA12_FULL_48_11]
MKPSDYIYKEKIAVSYEYPVYFTHSIFKRDNHLLASVIDRKKEKRRHRVIVYLDKGLVDARPCIVDEVNRYFAARSGMVELVRQPIVIPGGEQAKNGWTGVKKVMQVIGDSHMCRQSFVIAVGGGSILDMVGFAASLVHRGLRMIRIPSTVLAQNDAGIGVKNGMNERQQKNFIGAFAPPFAVINDFELLRTLKMEDWTGGISEAFKVAIIKDSGFFTFLCRNARKLKARNMKAMEELVTRCAVLHLDHIRRSGDPFEMGSARPLDFGHWAGHRLEMMSANRLGHGQAVAVGVALDSCYAMLAGLISKTELKKVLDAMTYSGLKIWNHMLEKRGKNGRLAVLDGLAQFREHLGGRLCVTLPDSIGRKCEVNSMDKTKILKSIDMLKQYFLKIKK